MSRQAKTYRWSPGEFDRTIRRDYRDRPNLERDNLLPDKLPEGARPGQRFVVRKKTVS